MRLRQMYVPPSEKMTGFTVIPETNLLPLIPLFNSALSLTDAGILGPQLVLPRIVLENVIATKLLKYFLRLMMVYGLSRGTSQSTLRDFVEPINPLDALKIGLNSKG